MLSVPIKNIFHEHFSLKAAFTLEFDPRVHSNPLKPLMSLAFVAIIRTGRGRRTQYLTVPVMDRGGAHDPGTRVRLMYTDVAIAIQILHPVRSIVVHPDKDAECSINSE